jgi:multisubunit Na+/H+ antiporter MnhF subunit
MDAEIWQKSKRGFPYNIPLKVIVLGSIGTPIVLALFLLDLSNKTLRDICLVTTFLSILGYVAAVKLIDQFKENLE